jgi:hypothetical protein
MEFIFYQKVLKNSEWFSNISTWELFLKRKESLLSNFYNYVIPRFYIIWKILKTPPVGRPIVAGYKWIFTPASIFVGHF